ncbi:MAG: transposase [Verrucomicrobia bacterium]|nr:transposase [Verrucomicrobiota bacterium]
MPRKPRHCPPGQVVHVCNRAVNRSQMFFCEFDYREVIKVLAEAIQKYPVDLFAYCLMPNHWHLLLRGRKPHAISKMLHWFSTKQSVRWRKMTQTTGAGAVYQNRFRSHLVIGGDAFLAVARYIERNPVSANLIRSPLHWKWSSASPESQIPIDTWPVPKPKGWAKYIEQQIDEETLRQIHISKRSCEPFGDEAKCKGSDPGSDPTPVPSFGPLIGNRCA